MYIDRLKFHSDITISKPISIPTSQSQSESQPQPQPQSQSQVGIREHSLELSLDRMHVTPAQFLPLCLRLTSLYL